MKHPAHVQKAITEGVITEVHWSLYNAAFDALQKAKRVTLHCRAGSFEVDAVGLDIMAPGVLIAVDRNQSDVLIDWSTLYAVTISEARQGASVSTF